jgi:hypothetical protein
MTTEIHVYHHLDWRALEPLFQRLERHMTAQTDKLIVDVQALITEAVADITSAIAKAQNTSPDPAIDALDASVTSTTAQLKTAIAGLNSPPVSSGTVVSGGVATPSASRPAGL